jgi:hypothetical protein
VDKIFASGPFALRRFAAAFALQPAASASAPAEDAGERGGLTNR